MPNIWRIGQVMDTKFGTNVPNRILLNVAKFLGSRLKNIYNKKRSHDNWDKYKKQRNFCVKLLRKTKQDCFNNIDIKSVSDTKKFRKTIKLYFSNKGLNSKL